MHFRPSYTKTHRLSYRQKGNSAFDKTVPPNGPSSTTLPPRCQSLPRPAFATSRTNGGSQHLILAIDRAANAETCCVTRLRPSHRLRDTPRIEIPSEPPRCRSFCRKRAGSQRQPDASPHIDQRFSERVAAGKGTAGPREGKDRPQASRARGHKGGSAPGHQVLPKLPPLKSVSATLLGDTGRFTDDQTCGCTPSIIFNREW